MAAQSFRERHGLQEDADFAFDFLDFAEAVGEGARKLLMPGSSVELASSGDVRVVIAQHGGVHSPPLKALGEAIGASVVRSYFPPAPACGAAPTEAACSSQYSFPAQ